ncbi:MAG: amino acid transporter, partial [Vicinamibacterales bacterium]
MEGTQAEPVGPHAKAVHTAPWWKVMCLTGVDYFSTLAYQPSIAFVAAGLLSPLATLVLILLTLFGALPMYYRVAEASPHGQGSILMLESLFPRWKGKAVVLILLGFAATSFVITITLSAADATAHLIENPLMPHWMQHPVLVTLALLLVLGAVFMRGFSEVIGLAVVIVAVYLVLNAVVIVKGLSVIAAHPELLHNWRSTLFAQHGSPVMMLAAALIIFPKLALGLSGFETGVAVMPLVKGDPTDTEGRPIGRIRNTKKLLLVAALIMSVLLMASSLVTTVLIPGDALMPGGLAAGRALAYLAHQHLGTIFGTVYDLATVAMLWFAGASALAGLLNLVPRYLPRYGMAPEWARANRPLIVIFTFITFVVTIAFNADVEAQGGAYATGVLVLISSGAVAVAIMKWEQRQHVVRYGLIAAIFLYTTFVNMAERPEGLKIASIFIATIIFTSLVSRVLRSTELRVHGVEPDATAAHF